MRENDKEKKVKLDIDEIETINIELEHSVPKLLSENELLHKEIQHLKKIYKDQFDSIKKTHLKGQIQEKVFVTTTLQNELRRLKGMFKLDIEPISQRLKNNRDAHEDYLKKTKENTDTICGLVERARKQNPSEPLLDSACMFTKHVQELLVYVFKTCPSLTKPSEKLVAVTPLNKYKKVRFAEPVTLQSNTKQQLGYHNTLDSNKPMLTSIGLKSSTSASRSQPSGNTKNNRILRPTNVKHSMLNANSELVCATYSKCMFDAIYDMCVLDFVKDVNVVQIVLLYLDSGCSKYMTGNRSQLMNFVSKFLGTVRFRNDQITKIVGYGDYHLGNVTISRVYYVEGLRHNLFSFGQFYDSDLEVAFLKNTCFIRNLDCVDLLSGSRDTNLYIISLNDMLKTSSICLLSKASKTKSWLWHRRLYHLNFGTLNQLAKDVLARGISKLKFKEDHLCLACALGKSKKSSHKPR
ncbi:retrovirus-related pol polyprotein from transposon TNT 1-94 [Tanacetum coccineum]